MRPGPASRMMATLLVLAIGLAGCGDDDPSAPTSTAVPDATAASEEAPPALGVSGLESSGCIPPGPAPDGVAPGVADLYAAVSELAISAGTMRELTAAGPIAWDTESTLALRRFLEDLYEVAEQDRLLLESLGAERVDDAWSFPSDGFFGATLADAWDEVLIVQATSLPALYVAETGEAAQLATTEICSLVDHFGSALNDLATSSGG